MLWFLAVVAICGRALAHEHHDDAIPEGQAISDDPIVSQDKALEDAI
jgi:hypothetical protein